MMSKSCGTKMRWVAAVALCLSTINAGAQSGAKEASEATIESNRDMAASLAWQDDQDFEFAQRGFIGRPQSAVCIPSAPMGQN